MRHHHHHVVRHPVQPLHLPHWHAWHPGTTVLVLIGISVIVAAVLVAVIRHAIKTHGLGPLVWRWFSGHTFHGRYYTDAGWIRRGQRVLHPTGHAARWHYLPRAHRAGIRTGSTLGTLAALYGLLAAPTVTIVSIASGALATALWGSWRALGAVQEWRHVRQWVRPLHEALAPRLGLPAITRPKDWLSVPRGFARLDNAQITMALPRDFHASGEASRLIADIVSAKLALEGVGVRFEMPGIPHAIVSISVPPPAKLMGDDLMTLVEKAKDTAPVIGVGRNRQVVTADLEADSPHILLSAGSGGGKSELTGLLTTQVLHRGGVALFLDSKKTSHQWAKGLPNCRYCRSIQEIHNALISLAGEIERRSELVDKLSDINGDLPAEVNIGPRFFLILEEANTTMLRLQTYWRSIKEKGDPNQSPAIDAWNEFIFMGRSMKMHAIAMGQQMNATASGGGAARESFALRGLARYQPQTWRILVGNGPMPKSSRHRGRWQIVTDSPKETQAGYLTNQEKRDYAASGIVTPFPDLSAGLGGWTQPVAALTGEAMPPLVGKEPVNLTGTSLHVVRDEPRPELIGLREAVDGNVVSISLTALRKARADDPEFPPDRGIRGQEMLYDADELTRWENNRERNQRKGA
jgi:hypothetical protein